MQICVIVHTSKAFLLRSEKMYVAYNVYFNVCFSGWTGPFCDQPCLNNTWGVNCENRCFCSERTLSCNPVNGECICQPGVTGKYVEYIFHIRY